MSYLASSKMLTTFKLALNSKLPIDTRETLITAYIAGAALALIAAFALSLSLKTGDLVIAAMIFPVSFAMLYLLGFNVLGELFLFVPINLRNENQSMKNILRHSSLVMAGNLLGALSVAEIMACSYLLLDAFIGKDLPSIQVNVFAGLVLTAFSCYSKQRIVEHFQTIRSK